MFKSFYKSRFVGAVNVCAMVCCATLVYLSTSMMPASAAGATDTYWIVGSFKTLVNADIERERIERLTAEHVALAAFYVDGRSTDLAAGQPQAYRDGEANIRLLVRQTMEPMEQRQNLQSHGLAVWQLRVDARRIEQFKESVAARGETLMPEYWLVLGSFHGPARARIQRDSLRKAGIDAVTLHRLESGGRYYFRVDHGPFDRIIASQRQRFIDQGITDAYWTRAHGAELLNVE